MERWLSDGRIKTLRSSVGCSSLAPPPWPLFPLRHEKKNSYYFITYPYAAQSVDISLLHIFALFCGELRVCSKKKKRLGREQSRRTCRFVLIGFSVENRNKPGFFRHRRRNPEVTVP